MDGKREQFQSECAVALIDQTGGNRGADRPGQFPGRRACLGGFASHLRPPAFVVMLAGGVDHLTLGIVVPVEATLGDTRLTGNIVHPDALDPTHGKQGKRASCEFVRHCFSIHMHGNEHANSLGIFQAENERLPLKQIRQAMNFLSSGLVVHYHDTMYLDTAPSSSAASPSSRKTRTTTSSSARNTSAAGTPSRGRSASRPRWKNGCSPAWKPSSTMPTGWWSKRETPKALLPLSLPTLDLRL